MYFYVNYGGQLCPLIFLALFILTIYFSFSQYHYSILIFINYCHSLFNFQYNTSLIIISNFIIRLFISNFQQPPSVNLMNQDNDDIFNDIDREVIHFAEIFPDLNNSEHSDYYSMDKFNEYCDTNVNDLSIIHCDIRSLYAHHDEFLALLSVLHINVGIFCFSFESWLTVATKQQVNLQGYQSFHSIMPINKREGGSSILIKYSLRAKHPFYAFTI